MAELEALEVAETYSGGGKRGRKGRGVRDGEGENKYVLAAREKLKLRVSFMGEWLVGECFLAFSNLVADNQYSVLGLLLLGSLARVKSILGRLMEDEDQEGSVNVKTVDETAREALQQHDDGRGNDFGEVVEREVTVVDGERSRGDLHEGGEDEMVEYETPGEGEQESTEETQKTTMARPLKKKRIGPGIDGDERLTEEKPTPSKPPKKKRKKGDAFDALFESLI